jgi:hypothetical protein
MFAIVPRHRQTIATPAEMFELVLILQEGWIVRQHRHVRYMIETLPKAPTMMAADTICCASRRRRRPGCS